MSVFGRYQKSAFVAAGKILVYWVPLSKTYRCGGRYRACSADKISSMQTPVTNEKLKVTVNKVQKHKTLSTLTSQRNWDPLLYLRHYLARYIR